METIFCQKLSVGQLHSFKNRTGRSNRSDLEPQRSPVRLTYWIDNAIKPVRTGMNWTNSIKTGESAV